MNDFVVKEDINLQKYTSFKVGGTAKFLVENVNEHNIENVIKHFHINYQPKVIGGGTNLLINDVYFDECIIKLSDEGYKFYSNLNIQVSAGMKLSKLLNILKKNNCSGLEILAGVPGTVGGAVFVNAGSKDLGIMEFVERVTIYNIQKGLYTIEKKDIKYSYRYTNIDGIILNIQFKFMYQNSEVIKSEMKRNYDKKIKNQPVQEKSAGCFFKNPIGKSAGQIIDNLGFKTFSINGAIVSSKHANFILNNGNAKADDIYQIMLSIQNKVKDVKKIVLEPEVRFWGF